MAEFSDDDFDPDLLRRWRRETRTASWAGRVTAALVAERTYREAHPGSGAVATLRRTWAGQDDAGHDAVMVIYTHRWWDEVTGLRRNFVDTWPWFVDDDERDLAEWAASNIADDMDEPLGRQYDLLSPTSRACTGGAMATEASPSTRISKASSGTYLSWGSYSPTLRALPRRSTPAM